MSLKKVNRIKEVKASDGFPVYARYGFSQADNSNSSVIALKPSYRLKSQPDPGRPSTLTALLGGPNSNNNLNIPIEMGAFTQDYEYIEGLGDLDQCNGRYGVTPEFPDGIHIGVYVACPSLRHIQEDSYESQSFVLPLSFERIRYDG